MSDFTVMRVSPQLKASGPRWRALARARGLSRGAIRRAARLRRLGMTVHLDRDEVGNEYTFYIGRGGFAAWARMLICTFDAVGAAQALLWRELQRLLPDARRTLIEVRRSTPADGVDLAWFGSVDLAVGSRPARPEDGASIAVTASGTHPMAVADSLRAQVEVALLKAARRGQ